MTRDEIRREVRRRMHAPYVMRIPDSFFYPISRAASSTVVGERLMFLSG